MLSLTDSVLIITFFKFKTPRRLLIILEDEEGHNGEKQVNGFLEH